MKSLLLALLLFLGTTIIDAYRYAVAPGGGITFVQGTGAQSTDAVTVSASFGATPTAGNTIVVCLAIYDETPVDGDITDNQGNTYTLTESATLENQSGVGIYIANNVSASGTFTVNCINTGTSTFPAIAISEWAGVNNTTASDDGNGATGTSTSPATGSFTANDAVVALFTHASGASPALSGPTDYTQIYEAETDSGNSLAIRAVYRIISGTQNPTFTVGSSATWAAAAVSLQE